MKIKPRKILAIIFGVFGLILLVLVLAPLVSYKIESDTKYPNLLSPVIEGENQFVGKITNTKDLKIASNWFEGGAESSDFTSSKIVFYTVSIPSLNIEDATVSVGGEDLSDNLIQYPGTALPGIDGNTVIFGHSVLPIFFNPKNYLTIFSTLHKIKKGEEVIANYDGVVYNYRVVDKFEVSPTDLQILEQNTDSSYLTLVTCSPPGHPLKPRRLIVRAKII